MTSSGPSEPSATSEHALVQHGVGMVGRAAIWTVLGSAVVATVLVLVVVNGPTVVLWLLGSAGLLVAVYPGLMPLLVWHGLQVRIDDSGVLFGSPRARRKPPLPFAMMRQPYFVPWANVTSAEIVLGREATAAMMAFGGKLPLMPAQRNGFFPRAGHDAHLALDVDPALSSIPWTRVNSGGGMSTAPTPLNPSRRWVFPVKDPAAVVAALAAHGVVAEQLAAPPVPLPAPEWASPPHR